MCEKKEEKPPVGSGIFARNVGVFYSILAFIAAFVAVKGIKIDTTLKLYIMPVWLLFSGIISVYWGKNRIKNGDPKKKAIGMETINMLVTMFGVAAAIAAIGG
jgi:hypothetical protein